MTELEQDGNVQPTNERREDRCRRRTVRSTGILQNNQSVAINVHLEVVNLNFNEVEVRLQVLNWGTAVTQTNPVSSFLDVTQFFPGNTRVAFNASVPASAHYEVRITVTDSNESNVLINTYARTAIGGGIVNGYTVLNAQFQTIEVER